MEIDGLNDDGAAVGKQLMTRLPDRTGLLVQPFWFDGTAVHAIGGPVDGASARIITNDDRMMVWNSSGEKIYDAATLTPTLFNAGYIFTMASGYRILWQDNFPSGDTYLSTPSGTTPVADLFPAGSGFNRQIAWDMNEARCIIGVDENAANELHGFLLRPSRISPTHFPPPGRRSDELVARILLGVIQGGGGAVLIGGKIINVPPRGPVKEILAALPPQLAQRLAPLLKAPPTDAESSAALRWRLMQEIARYHAERLPARGA